MARLRGDSGKPGALAALTPQELGVSELIGEGLTSRQIGQRLLISEKTVRDYVSALSRKLGLEQRTQAPSTIARSNRASTRRSPPGTVSRADSSAGIGGSVPVLPMQLLAQWLPHRGHVPRSGWWPGQDEKAPEVGPGTRPGGLSSGVFLPAVAFLAGMMHVVADLAAAGLEDGFPARQCRLVFLRRRG